MLTGLIGYNFPFHQINTDFTANNKIKLTCFIRKLCFRVYARIKCTPTQSDQGIRLSLTETFYTIYMKCPDATERSRKLIRTLDFRIYSDDILFTLHCPLMSEHVKTTKSQSSATQYPHRSWDQVYILLKLKSTLNAVHIFALSY